MQTKVILTIGISGSGKTTFVGKNYTDDDHIILCTDKLRGIIGTSESDQSVNHIIFSTLFTFLTYLLRFDNRNIVIDATSYSPKNRKEIIDIARKEGAAVEAICFDVPIEVAKARNKRRGRQVPDDVIQRQSDRLLFPGENEVDTCFKVDQEGTVSCVFEKYEQY